MDEGSGKSVAGTGAIVVTFALPQESSGFVRALRKTDRRTIGNRATVFGECRGRPVLVIHTGIGCDAATETVANLMREHSPPCLISSGFAGGLDPRLRYGDVVVATNRSAPDLVERARQSLVGDRTFFGHLETAVAPAETVADKQRLAQRTGALAVDMETSAIATLCLEARVPFLALRAISDSAADPLPVPLAVWFDLRRQQPRPLALLTYLARHPSSVPPFLQLIRGLAPARASLAEALAEVIASVATPVPPGAAS